MWKSQNAIEKSSDRSGNDTNERHITPTYRPSSPITNDQNKVQQRTKKPVSSISISPLNQANTNCQNKNYIYDSEADQNEPDNTFGTSSTNQDLIIDSKIRDELAESSGPAFLNNLTVYNARSNKLRRTAWHAFCHALWILYRTPNNHGEKAGNIEQMTEWVISMPIHAALFLEENMRVYFRISRNDPSSHQR